MGQRGRCVGNAVHVNLTHLYIHWVLLIIRCYARPRIMDTFKISSVV